MSSTMKLKSIHTTKRLCSIAASPPLKSAIRPAPGSPPPRRASVSFASSLSSSPASSTSHSISARPNNGPGSGSRTLYTHASGPLHHFDAPPPPHPLPISRPDSVHSNPYSGPRLSAGEAKPHSLQSNSSSPTHSQTAQTPLSAQQADGPQQSSHSHGQHGPGHGAQAEGGSQPILGSTSLTLTYGASAPPFDASPSDRSNILSGTHGALAAGVVTPAHEAKADKPVDAIDASASEQAGRHGRRIFQLDVGAYGIPKQGKDGRSAFTCKCAACTEEAKAYAHDTLDNAVQVGEDAYFVQEDALGVADGVGGWNRTLPASAHHHCATCSSASTSSPMRSRSRHSIPSSPSALFARRLMHFCALEANEFHSHAAARPRIVPSPAKSNLHPESGGDNEMTSSTLRPSLGNGGLTPRAAGTPRLRETGNARPFIWPWDENLSSSSTSFSKEDERSVPAEPIAVEEVSCGQEDANIAAAQDPFEGVIDPVDVLERAYDHAMDAHRVLRRTRMPKSQSPWFLYGLGRSSATPEKFGLSSDGEWQTRWEPLTIGSSTALLAVLSGDHLRIAHLGDCVGWLFRKGEVIWRSEEMWSGFNCPLQLGPASPTRPADARRYDIEVEADDILILASDGMGDNLWEEDVLDEVRRAVEMHQPLTAGSASAASGGSHDQEEERARLGRRTLAGILSESLCSRAHQVSTKPAEIGCLTSGGDDLPFARRAREAGRSFRGGKCDDISVLVAVISPVASTKESTPVDDS